MNLKYRNWMNEAFTTDYCATITQLFNALFVKFKTTEFILKGS